MEEINFPRGGSLPSSDVLITPFDVKKIHKLAERDVQMSRSKSKKQRRSLKHKEVDFEECSLEDSNSATALVDFLTFKKLTVGTIFLARIKEIHDTELVLALPNGLVGFVSISEISELFSRSLKSIAEDEDDEEDLELPHLKEFFQPGQTVMTAIVKLDVSTNGNKTSRRIECSVKPASINSCRSLLSKPSTYTEGLGLWGEVSSIEDKGYFLDLGVEVSSKSEGSLKFFLPSSPKILLREGDLLFVTVAGRNSRIVKLALENGECPEIGSYDSVFPGLSVQATVCDMQQSGIVLELESGLKGTMNLFQFDGPVLPDPDNSGRLSFPFAKGSTLKACVIYVDYSTKKIGLSLKSYSFAKESPSVSFDSVGKIVDAKVARIDNSFGVLFQLDDSFAYCISNRLSDDSSVDLDAFAVGTVHKARIIDYSLMDAMHILSLQPSILAQQFIRYQDVPVGSIVRGTIQKILPAGAVVSLTDSIRAFCPILWASDAQIISGKNPLAKYEPGKKIKFRVVEVVPEEKRITLSCKKSIFSPEFPIISSLEQAEPDTVSMGVVASIKEYGCFVNFFSNINGLVPLRELGWSFVDSPHDVVYVGKTVKCKVLQRNEKQLLLTLKVDKPSIIPAMNATNASRMIGKAVAVRVAKVVPSRGLLVNFVGREYSAGGIIHLTDIYDDFHCNPLESFYPGQTLNAVVVDVRDRNGRPDYFLSVKSSLLDNPEQIPNLPTSQPQLNDTVTGYVVTISDGGVFVALSRHLDGRIKIKELSVDYIQDWKSIYKLGDLVTCKVIEVNDGMYELSVKAVQMDQIGSSDLEFSWENLLVDSQYECTVSNVQPYGIFLRILGSKPPISGLCHSSQISRFPAGKSQYECGDHVTATVVNIDLEKKKVQFSISPVAEEIYEMQAKVSTGQATNVSGISGIPSIQGASLKETGFDWKCNDDEAEEVQAKENESQDSDSCDSDQEEGTKEKRKRISKKQRLLHEEMITKQESFLAESLHSGPRDEQDFQRACTSNPHDPLIYVQFMNWYLKKNMLDKARIVARTALKRIPLDSEQPRQIIWLALLSAENLYGNDESLERTLQEARQCTDEKSLLITFARILYTSGGKNGQSRAESVYSLLVKRFGTSLKCWMLRSLFYFLTGNQSAGRDIQLQAMRQLPQDKHPKATVQWALMERKHGALERSRTHFESLLARFPKRFDIWVVYWQSETDPIARYLLLERIASMKWSVKKSKLIFKTWLEAAKQLPEHFGGQASLSKNGREEAIQRVKLAAKRYVESLQ